MSERDTVWMRTDGVRVRMHVERSQLTKLPDVGDGTHREELRPSRMTLTPFGAENDGAKGEEFVLIGSVPA